MKREIAELREVVTKLVPMLTSRGLKVTQRGGRAYVSVNRFTKKPERVNIPEISDNAEPDFIRAINGFIDHEVAHVLITNWDDYLVPGNPEDPKIKRLQILCNMVEDTMIEREIVRRFFPGSLKNIADMRKLFVEKMTKPVMKKVKGNPTKEFEVLLIVILRALAGHREFQEYMDAEGYWDHPLVAEFIAKLPAELKTQLPVMTTTAETCAAARILDKILYPETPPSDCDGKGKKSGGKSKKADKSDKSEAGEGDDTEAEDSDDSDGESGGAKSDKGDGKSSKSKKPKKSKDKKDEDAGGDEETDDDGAGSDDDEGEPGAGDEDDTDDEDEGAGGDSEEEDEEEPSEGDGSEDDGEPEDSGDEDDGGDGDDEADDGGADGEDDDDPAEGAAGSSADADDDEAGSAEEDAEDDADDGDAIEGMSVSFDPTSFEKGDISKELSEMISDRALADLKAAPYRVYTREFDRIEKFVAEDKAAEYIPSLEATTQQMIGSMQKDIERLLASQSHVIRVPGYRSGRLHGSALHRIVTGDDRLFDRRQEHKSKDTAVSLVIDNSGSMHAENKIQIAMIAAYALASTLERVRMSCELIGFTTHSHDAFGAVMSEMSAEEHRGGFRYNRKLPLYMPIYKSFDERITTGVKRAICKVAYNSYGILAGNIDGECLEIAAHRLMLRPEKRKVMIVISDGAPLEAVNAPGHLKQVCLELEKTPGLELIGIGVLDDSVRRFYKKAMVLKSVEALPGLIMKELKAIVNSR